MLVCVTLDICLGRLEWVGVYYQRAVFADVVVIEIQKR